MSRTAFLSHSVGFRRLVGGSALTAAAPLLCVSHAGADIVWQLSVPGVQQSAYQGTAGTSTINFDSGSFGSFDGSVSYNSGQIRNADQFGGAGGTGKYYQTSGGKLDLHVTTLQYLGFWWSAMGYGDRLTIYRQSSADFGWSQVFQITGTDVLAAMDAGTVPTTSGQSYSRSQYSGSGVVSAYMNITLPVVANTWQYSLVWDAPNDNMEFDNVTMSGAAVPAPGALALLALGRLAGARRRR